jgi:hypothetical protein
MPSNSQNALDMGSAGAGLSRLGSIIADLEHLNQSTGEAFLEISTTLREISVTAGSISSGLKELTEMISGERGRGAFEVFQGALDRCRHMESRASERNDALESLRGAVAKVGDAFSGIGQASRTLRSLCVLTRIETARLSGASAEFGALADDVQSLANSMGTAAAGVLDAAGTLGRRAAGTLAGLARSDALVKDLSPVIAGVVSGLGAFAEKQARAGVASADLVSQSSEVLAALNNVVTFVQFHDITRQQVEHVIEALKAVSPDRGDAAASRTARDALMLQALQLANAAEKFGGAVRHLTDDLGRIVGTVQTMAERGRGLCGDARDEQHSFFLKMEQGLTALLNAAGGYEKGEAAAGEAAAELQPILSSMQQAAGDAEEVSARMRHLALNARISASRIGDAGAPLEVLSTAMHELVATYGGFTGVVKEALRALFSSVDRLASKRGAAATQAAADQKAGLEAIRATIGDLRSWSEISCDRANGIAGISARLCQQIGEARQGLSTGAEFEYVAARARHDLIQLASELGDGGGDHGAVDLEAFAARYTMQSEREVHAAILAGGESSEAPAAGPGNGSSEFGDGVELF